jgi:hypothetical protein
VGERLVGIVAFLDYDGTIRRVICSTNAIESFNAATGAPCGSAALSQRAGGAEVSVSDQPVTRPDRHGPGTMGHTVETTAECVRDHIPGAHTAKMIHQSDQIHRLPERPASVPLVMYLLLSCSGVGEPPWKCWRVLI